MRLSDCDPNDIRKSANEYTKQLFAELALAGLRRPVYAGIFRKLPGKKRTSYLCELIVDGYERNLYIRLVPQDLTCSGSVRKRFEVQISGLPLSFGQQPIALVQHNPRIGQPYLTDTLELSIAQPVVKVLPHGDIDGNEMLLCILHLVRSES